MRRFAVLVPAVFLLAGCGGSNYHFAATRACLAKARGVRLSNRVDVVASTAYAGAFTAKFKVPRNQVTISFGNSSSDAQQLAKGYLRQHGKNIGIADVLRPKRNVVMLWEAHPSDAQLATVSGCLK